MAEKNIWVLGCAQADLAHWGSYIAGCQGKFALLEDESLFSYIQVCCCKTIVLVSPSSVKLKRVQF